MRFGSRQAILGFTLLVTLASSLLADDVTSVVGSEGAILQIRSGAYSLLFPDGDELDATNQVLALDVVRPGTTSRYLVPGTENAHGESSATLYYEKSSDLTFLLWEGLVNNIHPVLRLATFDGARWMDNNVEIFGGSFTTKKDPQLVIRSDDAVSLKRSMRSVEGGGRTAVFVVWSEDIGAVNRKRMAPIIMQGGGFSGLDLRLYLDDFSQKDFSVGFGVDPDIREALRFQPSPQGATVGFLSEETNELVTLGVELLPKELSALAETVGNALQEMDLDRPIDVIVEEVQQLIMQQKDDFSPGSLEYISDQIEVLIRAELGSEHPAPASLRGKARAQIVAIGAKFGPGGLSGPERQEVVEIEPADGQDIPHHLKISTLSRRPAPEVGGRASLFLSRSGFDMLVAWQEVGYVYFVESEGEGWSREEAIELGEGLTPESVYRLLANRILNR